MSEDPTKTAAGNVSFEDMNLQVGTRLQLITHGVTRNEYFSSLIGYETNRYIFIRMPQKEGFAVPLKVATKVDVRIFSGVSIFTFTSMVEYIYNTPRIFVELAFPGQIRMIPLRKDIRINITIPVTVLRVNNKPLGTPLSVSALDLSVTGTMIASDTAFGVVGDNVNISFPLRNVATNEDAVIDVVGTIRNRRDDVDSAGKTVYRHGVLFQELRPFHQAMVQNFINDYIMRSR